jgi:Radical SAM superfamily/Domain of unknown function (DUF4070)
MSKRKVYLIHPKPLEPDQYEADLIPNAAGIADAAMVTVAALAPPDKFEFKLCEEYIEPIDFDYPADFVGITAKHGQGPRMIEIAQRFRARGIPVIFGGPHATLAPEEVRDHCDVLVKGELEGIAEGFFDDLYRGEYAREYFGPRGHIAQSPVPRWDLYPNDRALCGTLQTSRGCPFECEFCDVIAYLGRKQSHKTTEQVVAELEMLHRVGYRRVMLADDNLTVYRARAKVLLRAIAEWNSRVSEPISFFTQLSIEISTDEQMLELLADASVRNVFIGIETPNQDALKETKKRQNVGVDMVERTERFARHGIQVQAGSIVGFDSDSPGIFQQQLDFAMRTPIPIFTVSPLYAAHGTPLRERMARAGRLHADAPMSTITTNITPANMSLGELGAGVHWLAKELYSPDNFTRRVLRMIELFPAKLAPSSGAGRTVVAEATLACHRLLSGSPDSATAVARILAAVRKKPGAREAALFAVFVWAQRRYQLRHWETAPVHNQAPPLLAPPEQLSAASAAGRHSLQMVR